MTNAELRSKKYDALFQAMLSVKTVAECRKFYRDLCTMAELKAMAERWEVVQLVLAGVTYREISKQTGASTATVTRVAQWLNRGEGGYRLVLKRQNKI